MTAEVIQGDALKVLGSMGPGPRDFGLVLADPPYNVGKMYGVEGFDDKLDWDEYLDWLGRLYAGCCCLAPENATMYAFCPGRHLVHERPIMPVIREAGWRSVNLLTWYRPNGPAARKRPPGQVWAWMSEHIIECRKGKGLPALAPPARAPWYHNVLKVNTPQSNYARGRWHVCEKPVELYRLLILAHKRPGRVLDPTCGSGSALVACTELGIPAVGIDLNPKYCKLSRDRIAAAEAGIRYREARAGTVPLFASTSDTDLHG